MNNKQELTPDLEREIQKHHRSLKQFIDVSFDSGASTRKNSRRATKAREKLLKLSQAQFIELSTDVYDELHRRINESKEEPDHLLPRESFHPKRNQAREKLASLPAQRFKDLVNDILFEIERRDLHIPKNVGPIAASTSAEDSEDVNNNNRVGSSDSALQAVQHGVQSKTVIAKTVSMSWSSDSEDEFAAPPPADTRSIQQESQDVVPEMVAISSPPTNKHASNSSIKRGLSINKDREIQMLLEEGTKMDGKITNLEKALEAERKKNNELMTENKSLLDQIQSINEDSENKISHLNRQLNEAPNKNQFILLQSQYDALQSSHAIISDKHDALLNDFDLLKKEKELQNTREIVPTKSISVDDSLLQKIQDQLFELAQVETPKQQISNDEEDYKSQSILWQRRFEQARSEKFYDDLNKADLSSFQEYVGSVPKIADFQAAIESFHLEFNRKNHNRNDLFKLVSMVATKADLVCNEVNADDKSSSVVKACITHALVVARHYLTYQNVLPPIVLNIAVNDIALSICDLMKSVKFPIIKTMDSFGLQKPEASSVATPIVQDLNAPTSFFDKDDVSSPVRPLRMIERLNSPGVGGSSRFSDNERSISPNINSLQEKRLAIANSPSAPIVTQVVNNSDKGEPVVTTPNGGDRPTVASPRGPGIISLASKLKSSPKNSPASSKNITERVKKFDSPEPEPIHAKKSVPVISNSDTSDAFAKFGAKRRSSLTDETNGDGLNIRNGTVNGVSGVDEGSTDDDLKQTKEQQHLAELDYDKATAAANFNVEDFNILNPDNSLHELLLYLEHQTMDVISTIQTLLASIKKQDSTRGVLRDSARAINVVVGQMTEATNISMSQTRNVQLREHGSWVVQNLEDCGRRMDILCGSHDKDSADYADKNFKQRLAGVAFDIAKSTKELVKSVEELSLKQDIAMLDARLNR